MLSAPCFPCVLHASCLLACMSNQPYMMISHLLHVTIHALAFNDIMVYPCCIVVFKLQVSMLLILFNDIHACTCIALVYICICQDELVNSNCIAHISTPTNCNGNLHKFANKLALAFNLPHIQISGIRPATHRFPGQLCFTYYQLHHHYRVTNTTSLLHTSETTSSTAA
jgi:hypothetical protein